MTHLYAISGFNRKLPLGPSLSHAVPTEVQRALVIPKYWHPAESGHLCKQGLLLVIFSVNTGEHELNLKLLRNPLEWI